MCVCVGPHTCLCVCVCPWLLLLCCCYRYFCLSIHRFPAFVDVHLNGRPSCERNDAVELCDVAEVTERRIDKV